MKEEKQNIQLLGVVLAGVISVSSAGGKFDALDTLIGIVLLIFILPSLNIYNSSTYEKILVSSTLGLVGILIVGVFIESFHFLNKCCIKSIMGITVNCNAVGHVAVFIIFAILCFSIISYLKKKKF